MVKGGVEESIFDFSNGFMTVHICQNSSSYTPKMGKLCWEMIIENSYSVILLMSSFSKYF